MKRWSWVFALALTTSTVPLATTTVHADEKHDKTEKVIKLEAVPKPAQETIKREAGGSPILKIEEEKYADGRVVYEAEVRKGDDILEVKVDPSGKVVERETKKGK